jgi:hypothetical protein
MNVKEKPRNLPDGGKLKRLDNLVQHVSTFQMKDIVGTTGEA